MKNKSCQSCGMPLSQDPQGGGTNADGSNSALYCSYCFVQGQFTRDFATGAEMRTFVRKVLCDKGFHPFKAWLFTLCIPYLPRWKGK